MSLLRSVLLSAPPTQSHSDASTRKLINEELEQEDRISSSIWQRPIFSAQSPSTKSKMLAADTVANELVSLSRYEADLQQYLQTLLDLQTKGLLAGVSDEPSSDFSETNSVASGDTTVHQARSKSTSRDDESITRSSSRDWHNDMMRSKSGGAIPVRQPRTQTLSLRAARREIRQTMHSLSAAKGQESKLLEQSLQEKDASIDQITSWQTKREGLHREIQKIEGASESNRAQELKEEDASLTEQINVLEIQLAELKSQQRAAVHELSSLENSVKAKLSSFQASLTMLDKDIQHFLKQPPPSLHQLRIPSSDKVKQPQNLHRSVWELPTSRRTLSMALEGLESDTLILRAQKRSADEEIVALQEGARMWSTVVQQVSTFEKALRESLYSQLSNTNSSSADDNTSNMRITEHLEDVIGQLEDFYETAEKKGWNLLICCIGAELEALRQGHELLLSTVTTESSSTLTAHTRGLQDAPAIQGFEALIDDTGLKPSEKGSRASSPRKNDESAHTTTSNSSSRYLRPEDDEPDPDLLVSTGHDDY